MVIRGKSERTYTSGNPPAGLVEGPSAHGALEGEGAEPSKSQPKQSHKGDKHDEKTKYWLAERSIGEFSRTFTFPSHVDQDGVSASFEDGILTIIVPKVKKHESRRIHID
ncbi:30 kDa heat shock protein [Fusarium oxysporum f. sp. raphani]|nr:30 kDa heat shock protein [Fusarium oxysporum f. sp. raphani]